MSLKMPPAKSYENAIAVPLFTDMDGVFRTGLIVGGRTLRESLYWRGRKQRYRGARPDISYTASSPTEVIYAGHIINQFGHFLVDTLSKLWFAKERPDLPIVWMNNTRYKNWQAEILSLVGIKNKAIFLEEPTEFGKVHLPETGFNFESYYTAQFDAFLSQVTPSEVVPGRRCWLSRSALPADSGAVLGEEIIEAEAERLGWIIYHPQNYSVTDQLNFLSSCEDIAGWSGSAFHVSVLLREVRPRLHIFARGPHMGTIFREIADRKGIQQWDHVLNLELVSGHRAKAIWRANLLEVMEILKDITFK